jgi:acetyltransferase-like isoleucine patch superfamily enzyme
MYYRTIYKKIRKKIVYILCVAIQRPRIIKYKLLSTAKLSGKPNLNQPLQTMGSGELEILGKVNIGYLTSPLFFSTYSYIEARNISAKIIINEGTWINNNFTAIAEHTSISIGKRVLIGTGVEIYDSDFHGITVNNRNQSNPEWARPVVIEDDVFIGSNCKILKGVKINKGSVIANSSVVVKDIPAGAIAAGNPAVVVSWVENS